MNIFIKASSFLILLWAKDAMCQEQSPSHVETVKSDATTVKSNVSQFMTTASNVRQFITTASNVNEIRLYIQIAQSQEDKKGILYVSDIDGVILKFADTTEAQQAKTQLQMLENSIKTCSQENKQELYEKINDQTLAAEAAGHLVEIPGMIDFINSLQPPNTTFGTPTGSPSNSLTEKTATENTVVLLTQLTQTVASHRTNFLKQQKLNCTRSTTTSEKSVQSTNSTGTILLERKQDDKQVVVSDNIIYAGFYSKAEALQAWLNLKLLQETLTQESNSNLEKLKEAIKENYSRIVYVDDKLHQVTQIQKLAEKLEIPFIGIHFNEASSPQAQDQLKLYFFEDKSAKLSLRERTMIIEGEGGTLPQEFLIGFAFKFMAVSK